MVQEIAKAKATAIQTQSTQAPEPKNANEPDNQPNRIQNRTPVNDNEILVCLDQVSNYLNLDDIIIQVGNITCPIVIL
jgi:hypothetical protein